MEESFAVESMELGDLQTNCYLIADNHSRKAVVVDPADDGDRIAQTIQERGWILEKILLTHGHYDHIGGLNILREQTDIEVWIHRSDAEMLVDAVKNLSLFVGNATTSREADGFLIEGEIITTGSLEMEVLHTPGHTKGSVSFLGGGFVVVGDTLFQGSIGRTDFPGSSSEELITSIREKLLILPGETKVYPGHGPPTTIDAERRGNPFLVGTQSYI